MSRSCFSSAFCCNVEDQKNLEEANALKAKYEAAMEDDFNTADAIAAIFELVKLANVTAESGRKAAS